MSKAASKMTPTQRKWALIAFGALFLYMLARPTLEQRFNISLPGLGGETASVESTNSQPGTSSPVTVDENDDLGSLVRDMSVVVSESETKSSSTTAATPESATPAPSQPEPTTRPASTAKPVDATPPLGKLKEVGRKTYESTAGLRYGSGSAEGHRLLHVMAHAKDDPDKPVHGVFEGTKDEILGTIDEAWLLVKKKSPQVHTEQDDDRTVYTIDLKRKIGFTGGSVGKRRNHPTCRKLRIVVEGVDVITAFPTER